MAEDRGVGYYLRPLQRHVLLIALLVLLAVVGAAALWATSAGSVPYVAESLIIFKIGGTGRVDITQDPQGQSSSIDIARQEKNVALMAMSPDVAEKVVQSAKSSNDPEVKRFGEKGALDLADHMSVSTKGDFISVKASAPTAASATWLANTWTEAIVAKANATYASPSPNADEALAQVKAQLDKDQAALQDFLNDDEMNTVSQKLARTQAFITSAVGTSALNDATLYDAQRGSMRNQVAANYRLADALDQQLSEMRALRARIQEGPDDLGTLASNQVTLLTLWNRIVTAGDDQASPTPAQPQLQLNLTDLTKSPLTKSSQLSSVDSTITAVQKLQSDIRTSTTQLENKLSDPSAIATPNSFSGLPPVVQEYVQQQSELQSQLEKLRFQHDHLVKTRDLDQTTYDLLRSRIAEQQVNQLISGIVDIGWRATVEQAVRDRSPIKLLVLKLLEWCLVALVLGVILAYVLSFLLPQFDSNRSITGIFRRSRPRRISEADRAARVSSDS